MKLFAGLFFLSLSLSGGACRTGAEADAPANAATNNPASGVNAETPVYGYEVVNAWPHDPKAFTQGLIFSDGTLIESAGQYGESTLRRVELQTGRVLKKVEVPPQYFAEGVTQLGGKLYQLTWEHGKGFVYDADTFEKTGEFRYDGQGWGLTTDGESLILSDGTSQIRFINPNTFRVTRSVNVADRQAAVRELNELEYVKGEIWANVWHQDRIARIEPKTGKVVGWIDLKGLLPAAEGVGAEAVLNGIAYDAAGDRVFVTGKLWPKLFEVRLKPK